MGFKEGRVVDNGGEQGREAPQQQGGEELGDDGVLQWGMGGQVRRGQSSGPSLFCLPAPAPLSPGPQVGQFRTSGEAGTRVGVMATCTTPG